MNESEHAPTSSYMNSDLKTQYCSVSLIKIFWGVNRYMKDIFRQKAEAVN